jgi:hypothetical protein
MRLKIRHGPIVDDRPPTGARQPASKGDVRLGLPAPTPRVGVTFTTPQATTSPATGIKLNPENPTSTTTGPGTSRSAEPPFNYAKLGNTTTVTPGFGKLTPSGTGIRGQRE